MNTIIGTIKGNKVELGQTENGYIYKNSIAFNNKTDEICYIPELGIEGDTITEDTNTYKYSDFLELGRDYIKRTGLSNTPQDIAEMLFDCVDWQDPSTLLNDWEMDLEEEDRENTK